MLYKVLADIVVFLHVLWILFLICGAFSGAKHTAVKIIHLSGLAFALILQVFNWYCPLTYLEAWLRSQHDTSLTYSGSFLIHYLEQIVYIRISRPLILFLTLLIITVNAWFYLRKRK
jgi:hypothetical protein